MLCLAEKQQYQYYRLLFDPIWDKTHNLPHLRQLQANDESKDFHMWGGGYIQYGSRVMNDIKYFKI
jgi:hypothetical protein